MTENLKPNRRERAKAYRAANKERRRVALKAWRRANRTKVQADSRARYRANSESERLRMRVYYAANKERVLAKARAKRLVSPESAREACREWRKKNPEASIHHGAKRRARKRGGATGSVSYQQLWATFNGNCSICAKRLYVGVQKYHYDHIVPLARGGSHTQDNLQITHAHCNLSKHVKLLKEG